MTKIMAFVVLLSLSFLAIHSQAQSTSFKCSTPGTKCMAIAGYKVPNTTTISAIANLFGIKNNYSILGANNLPITTPQSHTVKANDTLKVPFSCSCTANRTGVSDGAPIYIVQPGDGLDHIARDVFSGLLKFQDIQKANGIQNPNVIDAGQRLQIPLPCSCDDVGGQKVVHYAHVVEGGSSLKEIAKKFGTEEQVLMTLNGIQDPQDLKGEQVLDVPLTACSSMVRKDSLDNHLRVSNGTYVVTANNCVTCRCDASRNWTLQCEPSNVKPTNWTQCPSMRCDGNLDLGNTTSPGSCGQTCAYTGYTNQSIMTQLAKNPSCPSSSNKASKIGFRASNWMFLLVSAQMIWLCLYLFH